jgi:hypothetical protein
MNAAVAASAVAAASAAAWPSQVGEPVAVGRSAPRSFAALDEAGVTAVTVGAAVHPAARRQGQARG